MTEQPSDDRRFSPDEAAELIRRATALSHRDDEGLTYEQVVEVASEVGIDRSKVEEALARARREQAERQMSIDTPTPWRTVADRCLKILCLKPSQPR